MTNEARDAVDQTAEFAAPERAVPEREDAEAVGVAARPRRSFVRATVAPIAVALAMSAGAGALVLVPQGSDTIDAVAAPQERVTSISRSAQRAVLPSTSATPTVVADWSKATVSVSPKPKPKPKPEPKAKPAAKKTTRTVSATTTRVKPAKRTAAKSRRTSAKSVSAFRGSSSFKAGSRLGLTPHASSVYADIMANFSGINSAGGYRASSRSVHQFGRAIDLMITPGSESALGRAIARYAAANAGRFKIDHIIFEQKIWTPYNPTWRAMEDRGSITENHYDHVHVAVKP